MDRSSKCKVQSAKWTLRGGDFALCTLNFALAGLGGRAGLQAVPLQAAVQRAAAEAEGVRGLADVPVVALQRLLDEEALHVLQRHLVEGGGVLGAGAQVEVLGAHQVAP